MQAGWDAVALVLRLCVQLLLRRGATAPSSLNLPNKTKTDSCYESKLWVVADQVRQPDTRLEIGGQPELVDEDEYLMNLDPDSTNDSVNGSDLEDEDDEEWGNWRVDDPDPDSWDADDEQAMVLSFFAENYKPNVWLRMRIWAESHLPPHHRL